MTIGGLFGILVGGVIGHLFSLLFPDLNGFFDAAILYVGLLSIIIVVNKYIEINLKLKFLEIKLHPILWWCIGCAIFYGEQVFFDQIRM